MKISITLGRERETNNRKGVKFDKFKRSPVHIKSSGRSEIDLSRGSLADGVWCWTGICYMKLVVAHDQDPTWTDKVQVLINPRVQASSSAWSMISKAFSESNKFPTENRLLMRDLKTYHQAGLRVPLNVLTGLKANSVHLGILSEEPWM